MGNAIVTQRDTQLEKQRAGYIKLSLTNFTTSAEPTIAAGSVVEISGSLYSFTTNESITGWAAVGVGDAYIKLVPDGTNPCTAEFTATAPTWSDAKQGWYDATGTDRYVAGLYKTSSTEYDNKYIIEDVGTFDSIIPGNKVFPNGVDLGGNGTSLKFKIFSGTLTSSDSVDVTHGLDIDNIYGVNLIIYYSGGPWWIAQGETQTGFEVTCQIRTSVIRVISGSDLNFSESAPYRLIVWYID